MGIVGGHDIVGRVGAVTVGGFGGQVEDVVGGAVGVGHDVEEGVHGNIAQILQGSRNTRITSRIQFLRPKIRAIIP